jgi:prepilin-type N-terminal cleavage/methylation domain-containing protein
MRIDLKRCVRNSGFSLIEVAVVLVIISILLVIVASPLAAQLEARRTEDTRRQLEAINEALIGFAMANGRLPCPSRVVDNGTESLVNPLVSPVDGICATYSEFLPAVTLGLTPQDQNGFAIDAWGISQNRIRYSVMDIPSTSTTATSCPAVSVAHPFTKAGGIKEAGMNCLANYNSDTAAPPKTLITVCANTPAAAQPYCTATKLTITAPFVVISLGKNAATGGLATTDEGFNSGTRGNGAVFVSHTPTAAGSPVGEFDDIVTWTSLNTLFARMVQAGKLP